MSVVEQISTVHSKYRVGRASHTIDSGHDEPNLCRIRGTCEMCVDLLRLVLVQADESVQDVVASRGVVITSLVVGEVVFHGADRQLFFEPIDLVQEQDYRRLDEPSRVADGVEKGQGLLHSVDGLIFEQQLVVLGNSDEEQNSSHVLEAVNPLLTLRPLATHVEHPVSEITNDKGRLGNTGGLDTGTKDILVVGHVVGSSDTSDVIEVASNQVSLLWESMSTAARRLTIWLSRSTGTPLTS